MKSYRPEELFDQTGRPVPELVALAPKGERRMGANPHANGGLLLKIWRCPIFRLRGGCPAASTIQAEATRVMDVCFAM